MTRMKTGTIWGLAATFAASALVPMAALADQAGTQKNKNLWRNGAAAGAAVAGYGLLKHNSTATVLGAAGGGYSAYRYEQDRHHQSQAQHRRDVARYHRHHYYRRSR